MSQHLPMSSVRRFAIIAIAGFVLLTAGNRAARAGTTASTQPARFNTPADALNAAENALGRHDYPAFVDCFSAKGQVQLTSLYLMMALMARQETASQPTSQPSETQQAMRDALAKVLAKHGIADFKRRQTETMEQMVNRLAGKIQDRREFICDILPVLMPNNPPPLKGSLKGLRIKGNTAHASYVAPASSASTSISQDMDFRMVNGSWKIATPVFFSFPDNE